MVACKIKWYNSNRNCIVVIQLCLLGLYVSTCKNWLNCVYFILIGNDYFTIDRLQLIISYIWNKLDYESEILSIRCIYTEDWISYYNIYHKFSWAKIHWKSNHVKLQHTDIAEMNTTVCFSDILYKSWIKTLFVSYL